MQLTALLLFGSFGRNVTNFWTDGTEPAGTPQGGLPANVSFANGTLPGPAAWMLWPVWHAQTVAEGATAAGSPDTWSLARSAWAGSHRHKTIVWSGDISSDWATLTKQVKAGLNAMLSVPYWNSDTGGFNNGDTNTMGELQTRWFQFSFTSSIMRLHGDRHPKNASSIPHDEVCDPTGAAGGPIEPWVYGGGAYESAIADTIHLREKMLPYIRAQIALTASKGTPMTRPLFYDFPADAKAAEVEDQMMFGPLYMVAPVTQPMTNSSTRSVYFPKRTNSKGAAVTFRHFFTSEVYKAGSTASVALSSNLSEFPLFILQSA